MTDKEIREIKRRLKPERAAISRIVGCFVNTNKQILYRINQPLGAVDDDVAEKLFSTMRKLLTGSVGTSLTSIDFSTAEVSGGDEHSLLERLRKSSLEDSEALELLYSKIAASLDFETNYVILLASDAYDVISKGKDGEDGESTELFRYFLLAVCPVKEAPEVLTFREADSLFHRGSASGILSSAELGFMYPAFDDRRTNIYGALYYTRSSTDTYPEFTEAVFKKQAPMPRKVQKETFSETINSTVSDSMTLNVFRAVQANVEAMTEAHKESRDPEPLTVTKYTVKDILANSGVEPEKLESLSEAFDEAFGKGAAIPPKTVLPINRFELTMPEVKINVSPDHRDLVSTRKINGEDYVLIKVSGPVTVNGIALSLESQNEDA